MILKITHLGTRDKERDSVYHVQTPHGQNAIVTLAAARVNYGHGPTIAVSLVGTAYSREYPASGNLADIPRIADLKDGYNAIASFIATWTHSTPEQREHLIGYDKDIPLGKYSWTTHRLVPRSVWPRHKWTLQNPEDRPRTVKAKPDVDGWARVYTKDLRAALKGIAGNVRIGNVTCKATIVRSLIDSQGAMAGPVLELRSHANEIELRDVDHKATVKVKHGAADPCAGRNGYTARIAFEQTTERMPIPKQRKPARRKPPRPRLGKPAHAQIEGQTLQYTWTADGQTHTGTRKGAKITALPLAQYEKTGHMYAYKDRPVVYSGQGNVWRELQPRAS